MDHYMTEITTKQLLLEAYGEGQRTFEDIELTDSADLSSVDLSEATFKHCCFNLAFVQANLSGCRFLECNLKTADFRNTNLQQATITGCTVESTRFEGAEVEGFVFSENSVYGQNAGQEEFNTFHHFT
ncbi:pentapeptide repeat-containing protein [Hymenobacter rigui]|uniref:Pentapeptide repeat-containing protein n=1 Tax=Hymenobacter rigui TaxID=334424 RepID=A0A428KM19_9BACT|nr:pentapeptide repeat-containing protein [Hymenobacter rigui]RSK47484.1 pentapeptide repeat-containing protein [Hymenobacter rigui]